jgi:NADH dehydrogenase/NADH:ubiquinone oxidoreductase subunit G
MIDVCPVGALIKLSVKSRVWFNKPYDAQDCDKCSQTVWMFGDEIQRVTGRDIYHEVEEFICSTMPF